MIHVIDETGTLLHDTYAKRAKGLVKKGRAYYVDDTSIRLVCPDREDNKMEMITKEDILQRIDTLTQTTDYLREAFSTIEKIPADLSLEQIDTRTQAVLAIVKEREATNQKMIALLERTLEEIAERNE